MENDKTILNPFMDSILKCFEDKYKDYTVKDYDDADESIKTPAIFVQLANFDGVSEQFPEMFRLNCTFRAFVCESFKGKSKRRVRDTAVDVAKFVHKNDWGDDNAFNRASFVYAAEDEFNEKINSSEVWYVEWEQQVYFSKDS